ncbi:prolipoprotein diacylglyceryl transferase family protein [Zavarzinella formosa]|uniref:prolipoprotein diacylglyceryl transferase family protein n=1 Tax=Zavarzinella formosa TaxID=360055 RepID=UPI0002E5AE49|nr:prolipoprotein diacylglyceryl transferase family protein [Zavarzinella formosa]
MFQVLFHIPILKGYFPPDGIPIHGFGVMLFLTFISGVWFLGWLSQKTGSNLPREKVQDLVIILFVSGLAGARFTYMQQYHVPLSQFFRIWEGGIVLYGGIIAGIGAFLIYYFGVLRRFQVNLWRLADATAPAIALGIALGRVGCLLNGCCYGHVADEGCPAIGFPLMTAPARDVVVDKFGYQTPTGFTTARSAPDDLRSVIDRVETNSQAANAGLRHGDKIIEVNGFSNGGVLIVYGGEDALARAEQLGREREAQRIDSQPGEKNDARVKLVFDDVKKAIDVRNQLRTDISGKGRVFDTDVFTDLINNWPRGDQQLDMKVERQGQEAIIPAFTPRTLGLHPTQIYESISMLLLIGFLLAYYPLRRHDGQVFTLFLACYAVHRFLNEILRNDTPIEGFGMSLSQNISVLILIAALGMELGLRKWGTRRV